MEYNLLRLISLLLAGLSLAMPVLAEDVAGKVGSMNGVLVAQRADGTVNVMVPNSDVLAGDMLVTAKDSYAQVVMSDGSTLSLRPNSNLKIEDYQFRQDDPKNDSAIFRLLKGGFRTVTGLIGKRGNPDAYKLRAKTATLGIRGTDFIARLCATKDCADDGDEPKPARRALKQVKAVGRVVLMQGGMVAKEANDDVRKLTLGSPVFEGDTLQSAEQSNAVVVFRDGGRITVQANSAFRVEQFKYDKDAAQENVALRLLKGGVRVATGLIAHLHRERYNFGVAGATIGVRGTGFDAWCNGPCAEGADAFGATITQPLDGAGVFVWSGEIELISPKGSFVVGANQAAIIERDTGKPVPVEIIPPAILKNAAPRPDSVPVDVEKLFEERQSNGEPGFYVTVHEGQVILSKGSEILDLGRGENGFASDEGLARLAETPEFMRNDNRLDNIENKRKNPNPSLNMNGCAIGQ